MKINTNESKLLQSKYQTHRYLHLFGYALFIWSIAYMLPHLYWAFGGKMGLSLLKPNLAESPQWEIINLVASIFLTVAGFLGILLIYYKKQGFIKWILLGVTLTGCSLATSHGIYGIIYRMLQIFGFIGSDLGIFDIHNHSFILWDLILFEPWFLIEGILLGLVGWYYLNRSNSKKVWLLLCIVGTLIGLITGLFGVRFA